MSETITATLNAPTEQITAVLNDAAGEQITVILNEAPRGPAGADGTGDPDIPATALPPENPRDGQPWRESGTQILSFWDASETAWIVPTTNAVPAVPASATRDELGAVILDDAGDYIIFADAA